ncbi:M48 family metallopeptidase [Thalassobius sp. S69A]|uniref:M48 family metallopeptidase n=1 Tax=unclassified Thalassovita TaxID=2619711 RepID=UPI000C117299|nr:zinc metalloprotease [Paracoccaceae bacterium]MBT26488.1 zinc metalloprotease [Paracoccaceae bacterium]
MGHHVLPGNPPISVHLRRSARARRISLRVSGLDGRVVMTLPHGVQEAEALEFAHEKADWIRGHLGRQPDLIPVAPGVEIPVEGQMRRLEMVPGRRVVLQEDRLGLPGQAERAAPRVQGWLRELARDRLAAASDHFAARLGRDYTGLTIRDTRSRWGSCSSQGRLMYSWRLIMAPPEILSYVAAHEVAHLAEMNHSQAFWDTVARIHGPHETARKWLRDQGSYLHRYRF